ncbi:MAG: Hint domain-containing protein [Pelagimonas sp.]|jgi:hypothetical protein|nr:Hint domain-containing protein [Pelagimonas sp.]
MPTYNLIAYGGTGLGYTSRVGDTFVADSSQTARVVAQDDDDILNDWTTGSNGGMMTPGAMQGDTTSTVISSEIGWLPAGDMITSGYWTTLSYTDPATGTTGTVEAYTIWNDSTNSWGGSQNSYVFTSGKLMDGVTYTVINTEQNAGVPWESLMCFARGTHIRTPTGAVRIEDLSVGDLVHTKDNGPQPIRWLGRRRVEAEGRFAPVRIDKGVLGNRRPLLVSPNHRLLLRGAYAELLFAEEEVLVPAKHLRHHRGIRVRHGGMIQYHHMLFDRHEIVYAEGAPTESFHPGDQAMAGLTRDVREEIFALFPELREGIDRFECAHKSLSRDEAAAIPALH